MPALKVIFSNRNLYLFGLFLVIVGMPMSKFLMSVGQFVLLGNWIIEGEWQRKWQILKTSRVLWILSSFYLMHLIGLLWTSDFNYAGNDLRIKLPLLWFPLLFATSRPLEKKEIDALLSFFIAATVLASIISMFVLWGWTKMKVTDIRDISIFNSHIRFALMIVLCICILLHDFLRSGVVWKYILKASIVIWFICFLMIMESLTGIVILALILFFVFVRYLNLRKNVFLKYAPIVLMIISAVYISSLVRNEWKLLSLKNPVGKLEEKTANGNYYIHDTVRYNQRENGNYVNIYICPQEMRSMWNKRSRLEFDGEDHKGNHLSITITRYLASKGARKDSAAIASLTEQELRAIENGSGNYLYRRGSVRSRIHQILFEYKAFLEESNSSGHSIFMRLEFWKNGVAIVKENPLLGVGTGDAKLAYDLMYKKRNSSLAKEWRLRSHNQFLAIAVCFGCVGLLLFLCWLFLPLAIIQNKHGLFSSFFIIGVLSMLNEDTLETQAGVTFFGFFYCLFLFNPVRESR